MLPSDPDPPNDIPSWTAEGFARFLRTGTRPNGTPANPVMPIRLTSRLTDDEIQALWLYLQTVPAVQTAAR